MPALFIVLDCEISGLDLNMDGTTLLRESERLNAFAEQAGVPPLMDFFSASREELIAFAADHDVEVEAAAVPAEVWHSAECGLVTVRALLEACLREGTGVPSRLADDLRELERILRAAQQNGVSWHLSVDF